MIYGFDCGDDKDAAIAALLVYATWRSRDKNRLKITPDIWGQVERFVRASAKRAANLRRFLDSIKRKLCCDTVNPKWMEIGEKGLLPVTSSDGHTAFIQKADAREFMTKILFLPDDDQRRVLDCLLNESAAVVLLVRDRLEREKPIESQLETEAQEV